jgi:hypothetical protein
MARYDDKEIVIKEEILLPYGSTGYVEGIYDGISLKFKIVFHESTSPDQSTLSWSYSEGMFELVFIGWNSPLGQVTSEPAIIGGLGNRKLELHAFVHRIPNVSRVFIQVNLGAINA